MKPSITGTENANDNLVKGDVMQHRYRDLEKLYQGKIDEVKHDHMRFRKRSKAKINRSISTSSRSSEEMCSDSDNNSTNNHSFEGEKHRGHSTLTSDCIRKVHIVPFAGNETWEV